ncbi:hypothetical protein BpHYR1_034235, partial [Brachionus plicatilis]
VQDILVSIYIIFHFTVKSINFGFSFPFFLLKQNFNPKYRNFSAGMVTKNPKSRVKPVFTKQVNINTTSCLTPFSSKFSFLCKYLFLFLITFEWLKPIITNKTKLIKRIMAMGTKAPKIANSECSQQLKQKLNFFLINFFYYLFGFMYASRLIPFTGQSSNTSGVTGSTDTIGVTDSTGSTC